MIYDQEGMYEKKCQLLEKIKDSNYSQNQVDEYRIQKIFESFYNCEYIEDLERLVKLEIYYDPILENKAYFLSKIANKSPIIVTELAEFVYKNDDGESCKIPNIDAIASNCYDKLNNLKIEFTEENGIEWCEEFLNLMKKKNRTKVMFHILGQLLARTSIDKDDKVYPSKNVRKIIEYYKSGDLASSFKIERYNERGVHYIGIGEEENALYIQYLNWANEIKFEYPETSKILKSLAETYKEEAKMIREKANYVR